MPGKIALTVSSNEIMKAEHLDYIDQFFRGEPSPAETAQFEQRLQNDPAFAEEVSFYLNTMGLMQEEAKKARLKKLYAPQHKTTRRIWMYAAAAAVIAIIVISYFLLSSPSPQRLANKYIQENLQQFGVTMGPQQDSLQRGISLYNQGKLPAALEIFNKVLTTDSANYLARAYAGVVYLRLPDYDKALAYFEKLEAQKGLYANPGKFYRAITLMKRNLPGDEQSAKELLQQVVNENLEGKETAAQWLKHF